ncbi:lipase family alpha/beta hydrolase [Corynebacterium confusum]
MRTQRGAVVAAVVAATLAAGAGQAVAASAAPFETSVDESFGINDPTCQATGEVDEPVVLLHGTSDNSSNWESLIPQLQDAGMCVWAFDYGANDVTLQNAIPSLKAIGDLDESGREVAEQVRYVRQATGSDKVNLVGHSQGGMHTKTYEQVYGDEGTVARVVAIGGNYHGTTLGGALDFLGPIITAVPNLARFLASTAATQQVIGSPFIEKLNALPDTTAGVKYTSIYSPADKTVTPNSSSQLTAVEGADVVNVDLGETCGASPEHPQLPRDASAQALILWGLQRGAGEQPDAAACGS